LILCNSVNLYNFFLSLTVEASRSRLTKMAAYIAHWSVECKQNKLTAGRSINSLE